MTQKGDAMEVFIPARVFYERGSENYYLGKKLLNQYTELGVEITEIENHNNIPELREAPDADFIRLKKYLIIGVRKSLNFVPNEKTSDYLVPYTSSGCPAMCQYCYLVCNYFKCAYLRVFVNREQMMQKILRVAEAAETPPVFEIGSNSDLVMENTVTGNLVWTIEKFSRANQGYLTFPTKFHMIDDLLPLKHNGKTIVRMSVNPEYIVRNIEIGTSPLGERMDALVRLHRAGYPVGLLIAPVVLLPGWEDMYEELVLTLARTLPPDLLHILNIEVIIMTYGYTLKAIHDAAFKGAVDVYDPERMRPSGRGKFRYKREIAMDAQQTMRLIIEKHLPECRIAYIC
jgi:spore photoproduct lyase